MKNTGWEEENGKVKGTLERALQEQSQDWKVMRKQRENTEQQKGKEEGNAGKSIGTVSQEIVNCGKMAWNVSDDQKKRTRKVLKQQGNYQNVVGNNHRKYWIIKGKW